MGRRVKHLARYQEIGRVLVRNGFGWFVQGVGLSGVLTHPRNWFSRSERQGGIHVYTRIRQVLEELGPTFVKVGQVASLRPDLLPQALISELEKLQDQASPLPMTIVQTIVERELGSSLRELFAEFDGVPIGSASIGQVHRAVLKTGQQVAVKVQRPDIQQRVETDLEILLDVARIAERRFDWAAHYRVAALVEEFATTVRHELDYLREARNAHRIGQMFQSDEKVWIPSVHWQYCTVRVLVMDFAAGEKLSDAINHDLSSTSRAAFAANLSHAVFTQMLEHGFFHADPHPGNILMKQSGQVVLIDFGMVGRLAPQRRSQLVQLVIGMMRRDTDAVIRVLHGMGVLDEATDLSTLWMDLDELREKYHEVPLSQINVGQAVTDIFSVAYRHRVRLPADLVAVGKTLVTLEGVLSQVDPTFSMMSVARPFGKRLLRERVSPKRVGKDLADTTMTLRDLASDLPETLRILTGHVRRGRIPLRIDASDFDESFSKLDKMTNRISFSIILLALSIVLTGTMVVASLRPANAYLWNIPLMHVAEVLLIIMIGWLFWAILRSGRF